jgi:hypothetical protein
VSKESNKNFTAHHRTSKHDNNNNNSNDNNKNNNNTTTTTTHSLTFATETVCCSIASWSTLRVWSLILSNSSMQQMPGRENSSQKQK